MGNCIITQNKIMQTGHMYYPVPLPGPCMEFNKNPEIEAETEGGRDRVVRIKLVITKQELQVMLRRGGVSVGDLASHMMKESSDEDNTSCGRWKPVLDSIPESN
ncbi:hypothetical protein L1987_77554 [Smallanthus sonchifolius]|uniref:Uncharacterized protein n=1 Tax=Smallanthus sonchifolius TaxID=185202 RepID=A0ACB8ZAG8_9ASTR|nr:hypothetical protein L1987_77554 [Smallanthus sonchifolius]